jgi:uncharacterized protein YcbX
VLPSGALENDRRWALRDVLGNFVHAKRTAAFHRLRSTFEPTSGKISLRVEGADDVHVFDLLRDRGPLERWLSDFLEITVDLIENVAAGFPDDTDSPGPTVVSTATLATVGNWFGLSLEDARRRFRANLEIDDAEPFWEDRLVAEAGRAVRFRIGPVELLGTNPCQRCVVPSRDPIRGDIISGFSRTFAARREQWLPSWAAAERFDHFYRLSVNTRAALAGNLSVGDEVAILGVE